jgi:hypothetical protein
MAHYKTIQAIKIKILPVISGLVTHDDIGLYVSESVQELRWIESAYTGLVDTWKNGILAQNGIGDIEKKLDTRSGGSPEQYSGLNVIVLNNNQLILRLKELGICLNGLTAELHEFIGTDADNDSSAHTVQYTGICEYESGSSWNENIWAIQIKNSRYQRNAFLGTLINNDPTNGNFKNASDNVNGKILPITIGSFKKIGESANPAKFIRTEDKEIPIGNTDIIADMIPADQYIFPVVAKINDLSYSVKIGLSATTEVTSYDFDGKWIKVVEGGAVDESFVGKYKKISTAVYDESDSTLSILLDSYFEKDLAGNSTATATGQCWISIVDLKFGFVGDSWKLGGFLDEAGSVLSAGCKLYSFIDKDNNKNFERTQIFDAANNEIGYSKIKKVGFRPVAFYGYEVFQDGNKNSLIINALLCNDNPDKLLSFDIFPLKNFSKYIASDLTAYGITEMNISTPNDNVYATFAAGGVLHSNTKTSVPALTDNTMFDKNDGTYEQHVINAEVSVDDKTIRAAYECEIDKDLIVIDYDAYFIGMNIFTSSGYNNQGIGHSPIFILSRRFIGTKVNLLDPAIGVKYCDEDLGAIIDNLPDFYYLTRSSPDLNKNFYKESDTSVDQPRSITGYKLIPISGITTLEQLKAIYKIGIISGMTLPDYAVATDHTIQFKELAIICQTTDNISSEVFTLCNGRIFDDRWGLRKTAIALITNPIDILEHFKRLQAGIEFGDSVNFGKAYSPSIPIKTGASTEGSYDDAILDSIKTYTPSFQIHDVSEAWTDTQIKNICTTFDICTYTDKAGYECVTTLEKTSPTETIAFAEIIKGSIGETKEQEIQYVYCQPILNYQYNYGSEKFDKQLAVLNIQAATWAAEYTPGFDPAGHNLDATLFDGEYVWTQYKTLYDKYRQIEQCPSSFTDQKMIVTYLDACKHLSRKAKNMSRSRQSFSVFYSKGKDYFAGKHVKIKLPHQTINFEIEVLLERVQISKSKNRVDLDMVLLEDIPTFFFPE